MPFTLLLQTVPMPCPATLHQSVLTPCFRVPCQSVLTPWPMTQSRYPPSRRSARHGSPSQPWPAHSIWSELPPSGTFVQTVKSTPSAPSSPCCRRRQALPRSPRLRSHLSCVPNLDRVVCGMVLLSCEDLTPRWGGLNPILEGAQRRGMAKHNPSFEWASDEGLQCWLLLGFCGSGWRWRWRKPSPVGSSPPPLSVVTRVPLSACPPLPCLFLVSACVWAFPCLSRAPFARPPSAVLPLPPRSTCPATMTTLLTPPPLLLPRLLRSSRPALCWPAGCLLAISGAPLRPSLLLDRYLRPLWSFIHLSPAFVFIYYLTLLFAFFSVFIESRFYLNASGLQNFRVTVSLKLLVTASKHEPLCFLLILHFQVVIRTIRGRVHVRNTLQQLELVGPRSLGVSLLTASFVGMVFTIQVSD